MSRRPRGLTPGERALWDAHARRYRPLGASSSTPSGGTGVPKVGASAAAGGAPPGAHGPAAVAAPRASPSAPSSRPPEATFVPPPFRIGERAQALGSAAPGVPASSEAPGPGGGARRAQRALARGRVAPQARLDLHGMTLDRAHPALLAFLSRAHADGLRLVLVITGKGRPEDGGVMERPRGVLRRQVPAWLSQPPLAALIRGIAPAHRRHGGEGALYVHLRRR